MLRRLIMFFVLLAALTSLSIQEAVDRALEASRTVQMAKIDSRFSEINVLQDVTQMSPQVSLGWTLTGYDSAIKFQDSIIRPKETSAGFIQVTQPLSPLVGLIQKIRADSKSSQAAKLSYEQTRVEIAFAAAQTYRQVQLLSALDKIAQDRVTLALKREEEAKIIFEAGRLNQSDFLRVQMRVGDAKVASAHSKAEYDSTLAGFKNLLGFDWSEEINLLPILPSPDFDKQSLPLPQAGEGKPRLDIQITQLQYDAAKENSWLSIASFLPVVNAFARVDKNFINAGNFQASESLSFGLTLTWNFWDGGSRLLNIKSASLATQKARLQWLETSRKADIDQEQKGLEFKAAKESLILQKTSLAQGEDAYKAATERFKLGALTVTDLLQSELEYHNTRVNWVQAIVNLDIKHMMLQKAFGMKRPESIL